MDLRQLFTILDGRIGRKSYWTGLVILVVITLIAMVAIYPITMNVGGPRLAMLLLLIVQLVLLYPSLAIMSKRFHDRNRPGSLAWIMIVPWLLSALLGALGITDPADPFWLDYLLQAVLLIVSIWFLIELGILKGTDGDNAYGPDPLAGGAGSTS